MSDINDWFEDIAGHGAIRDALEKMDKRAGTSTENIDWNADSDWEIFINLLRHIFSYRGEPYVYARRAAIEAIMGFESDADFAERIEDVALELLRDGDTLMSFEVRRGNRILSSNILTPKEIAEIEGDGLEL